MREGQSSMFFLQTSHFKSCISVHFMSVRRFRILFVILLFSISSTFLGRRSRL